MGLLQSFEDLNPADIGLPVQGIEIEFITMQDTDDNSLEYGAIIIDQNRPGTHEGYNVVFNSNCGCEYWPTRDECIEQVKTIIQEYFNG